MPYMTVSEWLQPAIMQLSEAGISTARLDAMVLLSDEIGLDRGYILAHPEQEIIGLKLAKLKKLLDLRATHVPLSYLRGKAEFYGREFKVGPSVLVPRPETETMIDVFKELLTILKDIKQAPQDGQKWRVADVGTGSGAVGITAALEQPQTQVTLLEIDDQAIEMAKANVIILSTSLEVIKSDLLLGTKQKFDILLCNLPYVPDTFPINKAASHEPSIAIFGGLDGLELYRQLFDQIKIVANYPLYIITEALPESHLKLHGIANAGGYTLMKTVDFIQLFELSSHYYDCD